MMRGIVAALSLLMLGSCGSEGMENTPLSRSQGCPLGWLGHDFSDSYIRHVGADQQVCDYQGEVTDAQCRQAGALLTAGSHGQWCQMFIKNNGQLLSLKRVSKP